MTGIEESQMEESLVVMLLRSPAHCGKIARLEVEAARAAPGVAAVLTAGDVPGNWVGWDASQPVLAEWEVRFRGELIAAVAAENVDCAAAAIQKMRIAIEETTKPLLDAKDALCAGSSHCFAPHGSYLIACGDVESAIARADAVIEGAYFYPGEDCVRLPEEICALPAGQDGVAITTRGVMVLPVHYSALCGVTHLRADQLAWQDVTPSPVAQAPDHIFEAYLLALLALRTGRAVRWQPTPKEVTPLSAPGGGWHVHIRDGVRSDGRILAREVHTVRDAGAYPAQNASVVERHCALAAGPYAIANVRIQGSCALTNRPPAPSLRDLGAAPATFAVEAQMDHIARQLGLDPWSVRLVNAYRDGERIPSGGALDSVALIEVIQALARGSGKAIDPTLQELSSYDERGKE